MWKNARFLTAPHLAVESAWIKTHRTGSEARGVWASHRDPGERGAAIATRVLLHKR